MYSIKKIGLRFLMMFVLPLSVLAAGPTPNISGGYFETLATETTSLLGFILKLLISLAVVWFIWNVVRYAMSAEEDGKEKAKEQMIHGIIAIAVIVSIWGIVAILTGMFGTDNSGVSDFNDEIDGMIPRT